MPPQPKTVDVDQLIATLPGDEQVVVKRLRALITECIPQATEKAYAGVAMPFYTRNRLICFILPPSVSLEPGTVPANKKAKGVCLGFNQGKLMSNEDRILQAEGRKQVYVMYFRSLDDVDERQVSALLFEAAIIDEQFAAKKKKK
jgi:hypothetical protein